MNNYELVVLAISLSMDSFSTALCEGVRYNNLKLKNILLISFMFSLFQSLMPFLGYLFGYMMSSIVFSIGHILSFFIFIILGIGLIRKSNNDEDDIKGINLKSIILLSIAISIDAFSVGITFVNLNVNIFMSLIMIFMVTFITTVMGVVIGNKFGGYLKKIALKFGGLVLISLGIKVLFT